MIRGFILISLLLTITAVAFLGFRGKKSADPPFELFPDMVRQPKIRAQAPSDFFSDGRGGRLPIDGTVPIGYEPPRPQTIATPTAAVPPGQPREHLAFSEGSDYYDSGKMDDHWGTGLPVDVTPELMRHGRDRFNITCAMCHGATAAGNGIAKQHGLATVVTLQDDRIRGMADGEIFNTITNGKNTMMAYGSIITVADRWAIIAYLRALQRSQHAMVADVPENERAALDKQ
jgi:mono/diheme cytochrome c family protein